MPVLEPCPDNLRGKNPNWPEIEPCANCGAMPVPPGTFGDGQWGIRCSWCAMQVRAASGMLAIAHWNRRPATQTAA